MFIINILLFFVTLKAFKIKILSWPLALCSQCLMDASVRQLEEQQESLKDKATLKLILKEWA